MKYLKKFNEGAGSYPTINEVESASPDQILTWHRFLPTPSNDEQIEIINLIFKKYTELSQKGDINSSTSKRVGWGEGPFPVL